MVFRLAIPHWPVNMNSIVMPSWRILPSRVLACLDGMRSFTITWPSSKRMSQKTLTFFLGGQWVILCYALSFFYLFQTHSPIYPTLALITRDICGIPASSVPCKQLFLPGAEVAIDWHSRLGSKHEDFSSGQARVDRAWESRWAESKGCVSVVSFQYLVNV